MVKHITTFEGSPADEGCVWIFYEATQAELAKMQDWCFSQFGHDVAFGTQDLTRMVDFGFSDIYRMPFIFQTRSNAMKFRLSW